MPDAQPIREFLEPQLRDARTNSLEMGFRLRFADGLPIAGATSLRSSPNG